jgi:hypothetical protein
MVYAADRCCLADTRKEIVWLMEALCSIHVKEHIDPSWRFGDMRAMDEG